MTEKRCATEACLCVYQARRSRGKASIDVLPGAPYAPLRKEIGGRQYGVSRSPLKAAESLSFGAGDIEKRTQPCALTRAPRRALNALSPPSGPGSSVSCSERTGRAPCISAAARPWPGRAPAPASAEGSVSPRRLGPVEDDERGCNCGERPQPHYAALAISACRLALILSRKPAVESHRWSGPTSSARSFVIDPDSTVATHTFSSV